MKKAAFVGIYILAGLYSVWGGDEPIQFAGLANENVHVREGRNGAIEGILVSGTNIRFQWFHQVQNYPSGWKTNVIAWATNSSLSFTPFEGFDWGAYYLVASNSVSIAQKTFYLNIVSAPRIWPYNEGGWLGAEGEVFSMSRRLEGVSGVEWFHNGNRFTPEGDPFYLLRTLTPETEGMYWATGTNEFGDLFTSPVMLARIKPVTEIKSKFRGIHPLTDTQRADPISGWNLTVHDDGAITMTSYRELYRWKSGVTQKILETDAQPAGFEGTNWYIRNHAADENFADLLIGPFQGGGKTAVFRKSTNGYQMLAEPGLLLRGELTASGYMSLQRAGGKTAFWALTADTNRLSGPMAILVYDGAKLSEWFNSKTDFPEPYKTFGITSDFSMEFGFDGETAAFVGYDFGLTRHHGVFAVTAAGEFKTIALRGESIPGTGYSLAGFHQRSVVVSGGKVLFRANVWENFSRWCLVEYDPNRTNQLKIIALEGDVIENDYAINGFSPDFEYLSDGSIIFEAGAGRFKPENVFATSGNYLTGIFRHKDGVTTHEIDSRQKIGGQQMEFLYLSGAGGTNFVVGSSAGFMTTAPGGERPVNAAVSTTRAAEGFRAGWAGDGVLQASGDLITWRQILYSPGIVTNQLSTNAQYFRVFYP